MYKQRATTRASVYDQLRYFSTQKQYLYGLQIKLTGLYQTEQGQPRGYQKQERQQLSLVRVNFLLQPQQK